ncbi:hypothetical protein MnTg02_01583 [bacterium MnTg02]|nr:hypothetical protein MnTg02_01583 [bacterium MnTg02]
MDLEKGSLRNDQTAAGTNALRPADNRILSPDRRGLLSKAHPNWFLILLVTIYLAVSSHSTASYFLQRFEIAHSLIRMAILGAPHIIGAAMSRERPFYHLLFGGYVGANYTSASSVFLKQPDQTDMRLDGVHWIGKPFKAPIYYGVRGLARQQGHIWLSAMVDFTHIKAVAERQKKVRQGGQRSGAAVPEEESLSQTFDRLDFTHGHNLLTLNGVLGRPIFGERFIPYIGLGSGVAISHVEVTRKGKPREERTFEYQIAGPVLQFILGCEVRVSERFALFFEYKLSIAAIGADLTGGGSLTTNLWTHQGVSGVLIRIGLRRAAEGV